MEEVAPVMVADTNTLAPEEVKVSVIDLATMIRLDRLSFNLCGYIEKYRQAAKEQVRRGQSG